MNIRKEIIYNTETTIEFPIRDYLDGVTLKVSGVTLAGCDIAQYILNGGSASSISSWTFAYVASSGMWRLTIPATATYGRLEIEIADYDLICDVHISIDIVSQQYYDFKHTETHLPVNTVESDLLDLDSDGIVNANVVSGVTTPPTVEQIRTELEENGSYLDLIKDQTDQLQFNSDGEVLAETGAADVDLSPVQEVVDAIKLQTDQMEFDSAGNINAVIDDSLLAKEAQATTNKNDVISEIDDNEVKIDAIQAQTDLMNFDSAGNIDANAVATVDTVAIVDALMAATGITVGGTLTYQKLCKILAAWIAGNWRAKSGNNSIKELLDADDGATVILEMELSTTTPYRSITIKI